MSNKLLDTVLPGTRGHSWLQVDLDALARLEFSGHNPNPLVDPAFCDVWVKSVATKMGADYTWGGWMEDRSALWRDHYLEKGCTIHLGIDANVPEGTLVAGAVDGEVVFSQLCSDSGGGWGGWVIARSLSAGPHKYLIYAHLGHDVIPPVGSRLSCGVPFASVGGIKENGGWFPHLHLQAMSEDAWSFVEQDISLLDGYAHRSSKLTKMFPDPATLCSAF